MVYRYSMLSIVCIIILIGNEDIYTFEDAERDGPSSGQIQETEHLLRGMLKPLLRLNISLSTYSRPSVVYGILIFN